MRYKAIITELGYTQQRCSFHLMKNLKNSLSKRHNSLRRKIKTFNKKIPEKENKLKEKYPNKKGRSKKNWSNY